MSHQIRQVKGSSATKVRHSEPRGPKPTFTRKTSAAAERELVDVTHTEPMTTGFDLIFSTLWCTTHHNYRSFEQLRSFTNQIKWTKIKKSQEFDYLLRRRLPISRFRYRLFRTVVGYHGNELMWVARCLFFLSTEISDGRVHCSRDCNWNDNTCWQTDGNEIKLCIADRVKCQKACRYLANVMRSTRLFGKKLFIASTIFLQSEAKEWLNPHH